MIRLMPVAQRVSVVRPTSRIVQALDRACLHTVGLAFVPGGTHTPIPALQMSWE